MSNSRATEQRRSIFRVLHFVSSLSTGSGVMSVIMNYYRNVDRSTMQFDFMYFNESSSSHVNEITLLGGKAILILRPGSSLNAHRQLTMFFQRHAEQYAGFHIHEVYLSFYLLPLAKRYGVKNCIVHAHATRYSDKLLASWRNRLLCLPLKWLHYKKMACSEKAGTFLFGKRSLKDGEIFILYNSIDYMKYRFKEDVRQLVRRRLNLEENLVIGHIGRFEVQKNHRFLLKVFADVHYWNRNTKLLLLGTGSLLEQIREQARVQNLQDSVIFCGDVTNVSDYLQAMDIFVLPSIYEGLPVSCIEAQANGLPCILSASITKEVHVNKNIKFLNISDKNLWVNEILNIPTDRDFSIYQCSKYDIALECQRLCDFYRSLI